MKRTELQEWTIEGNPQPESLHLAQLKESFARLDPTSVSERLYRELQGGIAHVEQRSHEIYDAVLGNPSETSTHQLLPPSYTGDYHNDSWRKLRRAEAEEISRVTSEMLAKYPLHIRLVEHYNDNEINGDPSTPALDTVFFLDVAWDDGEEGFEEIDERRAATFGEYIPPEPTTFLSKLGRKVLDYINIDPSREEVA